MAALNRLAEVISKKHRVVDASSSSSSIELLQIGTGGWYYLVSPVAVWDPDLWTLGCSLRQQLITDRPGSCNARTVSSPGGLDV